MTSKRSIALAIHGPDDTRVLLVQRPPDDEDLPNEWGLPAASLRDHEDWEDAAHRAAREKLGIAVSITDELNRGSMQRSEYVLEMRLFSATIVDGEPYVRDDVAGVTHYQKWKWGSADALAPAARLGSLCCRLFLEWSDRNR